LGLALGLLCFGLKHFDIDEGVFECWSRSDEKLSSWWENHCSNKLEL